MQTQTNQPQPTQPPVDLGGLLSSPLPWLLGMVGFLIILGTVLDSKGRRDPDDARWANGKEKRNAKIQGLKQIRDAKIDEIGLRLGSDDPLIISDCQPLIKVLGGSGYGKTKTVVELILADAIKQGHTILCFDIKGKLKRRFIPYALQQPDRYDCFCFAPGKAYSDSLDFLGFLRHVNDAVMGRSMAGALADNVVASSSGKHPFFDNHAEFVLTALFMMAKQSCFKDLPMVWELLALPDLAKRIESIANEGGFSELGSFGPWIGQQLTGLQSVSGTKDTEGGIIASGINYLLPLVNQQTIPCLTGSSIPLDLPGRQIIFFELDGEAKSVTAPLVATAINMLIQRNLNETVQRDRPFCVIIDEFARLVLPQFEEVVSLDREYGFYGVTSFQSNNQPKIKYKAETADSIFDNASTSFIFRAEDYKTREQLSQDLGDYELMRHTHSRSYGKGGTNRTRSEQPRRKPLVSKGKLKRLRKGEFVMMNAGMDYRPVKMRYNLKHRNKTDNARFQECESIFDSTVMSVMLRQTGDRQTDTPNQHKENRQVMAEQMLPNPKEVEAEKLAMEANARA